MMNAPNAITTIRIRRLRVVAEVESMDAAGTLVALREEPFLVLEADFRVPFAQLLMARGVPASVLGIEAAAANGTGPQPPTSSTATSETLLPHQYAVADAP